MTLSLGGDVAGSLGMRRLIVGAGTGGGVVVADQAGAACCPLRAQHGLAV